MIGTMTPATRALDLRTRHPHTSDIDTVKAQERQERRKTQRGPPAVTFKRLMHIERMRELMRGPMPPVPIVKVLVVVEVIVPAPPSATVTPL